MRLGSVCTGIGGLDLAVEAHFGAELAWCAEIDPAASRVLEARFPHAPNIGNFIGQNPPTVDVLCGGFPCQPVSLAGKRAGTDDDRWLFDDICDLVGRMEPRPRWLVFENVRGLLSANGGDAMARVVEGLARLGYVGSWRVVRASDVGAPHRRERVFVVAAYADGWGRVGFAQQHGDPTPRFDGSSGGHADGRGVEDHGDRVRRPEVEHGGAALADASGARTGRDGGAVPRTPARARRPGTDVPAAVDRGAALADADGAAPSGERRQRASEATHEPGTVERLGRCDRVDFGPFGPAVERWERLLGRAAPAPVDDRRRLNPQFVEWMMGIPEGWVTDILDRRTDALRCLGNAVVPQQAAHALRVLMPHATALSGNLTSPEKVNAPALREQPGA